MFWLLLPVRLPAGIPSSPMSARLVRTSGNLKSGFWGEIIPAVVVPRLPREPRYTDRILGILPLRVIIFIMSTMSLDAVSL